MLEESSNRGVKRTKYYFSTLQYKALCCIFCSGQLFYGWDSARTSLPAPCDLSLSFLSAELSMRRSSSGFGLCWSFPVPQEGKRLSCGIPTLLDLSRAESTALLHRRGRACLKAQIGQRKTTKIPCFQFFYVAVWQVLVLLCHTDLPGLVSVVCTSLAEWSLCLYTHQELNLTCCSGLCKIDFSEVRMAALSDTEIIPSHPCGRVCHSHVTVKQNPQVSLQLLSKSLITALYVTNSDKLFLW